MASTSATRGLFVQSGADDAGAAPVVSVAGVEGVVVVVPEAVSAAGAVVVVLEPAAGAVVVVLEPEDDEERGANASSASAAAVWKSASLGLIVFFAPFFGVTSR
jgi:hypothetical protein